MLLNPIIQRHQIRLRQHDGLIGAEGARFVQIDVLDLLLRLCDVPVNQNANALVIGKKKRAGFCHPALFEFSLCPAQTGIICPLAQDGDPWLNQK
jgi:hypothetical protein